MLWSIASVLVLLWVLGMITSTMVGGFLHLLVAIAAMIIAAKLIPRKKRPRVKLQAALKYQRADRYYTERDNQIM